MLLHSKLKEYRLILASQSPRRKQLLSGLDLNFEVLVRDGVEETFPEGLGMTEIPEYLARKKSEYYTDLLGERTLVITADTIVWKKGRVIGKPENYDQALQTVRDLAGTDHDVVTGVCIRSADKMRVFHSKSRVFFSPLTDEEVEYYVNNYQPMDKAGAYGIQEWIGYVGIEKIDGSFYNVMGLPVQRLYRELGAFV